MDDIVYPIPDNIYLILKWVALVVLPALATFISIVGPAWGFEVNNIVTTINAIGVFIGALLGYSQYSGKKAQNNAKEGGVI